MTKQLCIFCREDGGGLTALHIDGQPIAWVHAECLASKALEHLHEMPSSAQPSKPKSNSA